MGSRCTTCNRCIAACSDRQLHAPAYLSYIALAPAFAGALLLSQEHMRAIPITARGAEKLRAELQRLRGVDRPTIIQAIKDAREKGDLTENAEYDAARERQGFVEGRIQELEGKVSALQIIDPATVDAAGRVVFGATVELEDQDTGDVVRYQIVGDDEADIKAGWVSVSSPIARALIGKSEGDIATVIAPAGEREYSIVSVSYK